MKLKKMLILAIIAMLVLGSAGAALAISSANYGMPKNSNEGGGAGGSLATSASYQLSGSLGGAVQVSSSSSGYQLCSGFLCGGAQFFAVAGITVAPTSGLVTTEGGGTATFTVVLDSQPAANVTIGLSSSDTTEGTVSPGSLTFTPANWNTAQTVTVTGVDDSVADGNVAYTITTAPASSSDSNYNGVNAADVSVTNNDNEKAIYLPISLREYP